ncbi:uncharacterized protein VICG_00513 [Vittaforma corneae ATCC 50505]|uniref:Uncharacterized protein n=1 Tax=Vittaforma corneae (strain ATCC 50505) TaxID=993615 RepID=L2GP54_VITCO|nr:uncharacterized protein VICG_00513 [Vittaforma corneae ATCC 50505]ELA42414.1 hypothetical protein VICG_00513 [Vittaforma corneae ATCC 50505]
MKIEQKIKELNRKIEKKSNTLLHNITTQIDHKYKDLCASTDHAIRREKQDLKKKSSRLLKKMEEKVNEQNERIARMKRKIQNINEVFRRFESDSVIEKIGEIKMEIERLIQLQNERYDQIRSDQRKIYKTEFEKLQGMGEGLVEQSSEKLKGLL